MHGASAKPEPFRIKMVEPIRCPSREERERLLQENGYNPFLLPAEAVFIDLLTDSGTSAMSQEQWAGLHLGDEAYAGSSSFYHLQESVQEIMGLPHVLPTHQGRGAEHLLFSLLVRPGQFVVNNIHFDTTRAHVYHRGARPADLVREEAYNPGQTLPFKGDMDIERLEEFVGRQGKENVGLVMLTVTCNSAGGQPVSMANIRGVAEVCRRHQLPLFLDACRFAENAYFIQQKEEGYQGSSLREIAREMFSYVDGCTMSGKKDALVNIGGFLAVRDQGLLQRAQAQGVLFEGFPTYGGLAGRDLEAMARGLREVVEQDYMEHRIEQLERLGNHLRAAEIPMVEPVGGHGLYLDAGRFLPHLDQSQFPGLALEVELYREGAVRSVEIGTVMAGRNPETGDHNYPPMELVRLAIPRRAYTHTQLDYVAEVIQGVWKRRADVPGYRFTYEPPVLRHFTARFEPLKK